MAALKTRRELRSTGLQRIDWWPFPLNAQARALILRMWDRDGALGFTFRGTRGELAAAGLWHPAMDEGCRVRTLRPRLPEGLESARVESKAGKHIVVVEFTVYLDPAATGGDRWALERLVPRVSLAACWQPTPLNALEFTRQSNYEPDEQSPWAQLR